jgi:hypothetical protein
VRTSGTACLFAVAILIACAAESVHASSYDVSCSQDDGCLVVFEVVSGKDTCSLPCAAINKEAADKYNADADRALHACSSVDKGECHGVAVCRGGTCTFEASPPRDAGTD